MKECSARNKIKEYCEYMVLLFPLLSDREIKNAISNMSNTGSNKKVEPAKYFEKYTLNRKVKKYVFSVFKELHVDKIDDVPDPLGC